MPAGADVNFAFKHCDQSLRFNMFPDYNMKHVSWFDSNGEGHF